MTNKTPSDHPKRGTAAWSAFVSAQEARIRERLARYHDIGTVKEQLAEQGDLSPYQRYKTSTVTRYLLRALAKVREGSYGVCDVCGGEIGHARLLLVPGAVQCAGCGRDAE